MSWYSSKELISVIIGVPVSLAIGWFLDPMAGFFCAAAVLVFFLFARHNSVSVRLSAIADDVRAGFEDAGLMEKHCVSKEKLGRLLTKLVDRNYLKRAEADTRVRFFRRTAKQKTFEPDDSVNDPRVLTDISPYAFMHPLDAHATRTLQMISVLNVLIAKMLEFGYDRILRTWVKNRYVRATPTDFGYLYEMVRHAAERLDLGVVPELYVSEKPTPNAWTSGENRPFIVVHVGLLELMGDDEIHSVIAHEAGHIKSHHVLYHSLAMFLKEAGHAASLKGLILDHSFCLAFMAWMRASELSADRAALVVTGSTESVVNVFKKFGALYGESTERIPERSSEGVKSSDLLRKIFRLPDISEILSSLNRTHPMLNRRIEEVEKWSQSDRYRAIMDGQYVKISDKQLQVIAGVRSHPDATRKGSVKIIKNRIMRLAELLPEYGDTLREWIARPHDHVEGALGRIEEVADRIGDYLKKGGSATSDETDGGAESRAAADWAKVQAGLKEGTAKARVLLRTMRKRSSDSE